MPKFSWKPLLKPSLANARLAATAALLLLIAVAMIATPPGGVGEMPAAGAQTPPPAAAPDPPQPIEQFLQDRAEERAEERRQLEEILKDYTLSTDLREDAARQILMRAEAIEQETTLEGVLRARGYGDPVVTVHPGSVNVLLRSGALDQRETAAILELAMRETGQGAGDIRIMPVD